MNSTVTPFEIGPFSIDADLEEVRRPPTGGARAFSPRQTGPGRQLRPASRGPRRDPRKRFGGYAPVGPGQTLVEDTAPPAFGAVPSEQIRWVQFMLNNALGVNLPVDGLVSPGLRAALRDFQGRQGLPVSGFVGPDTIDALQRAGGERSGGEAQGGELEFLPEFETPKLDLYQSSIDASLSRSKRYTFSHLLHERTKRFWKDLNKSLKRSEDAKLPGLYRLFNVKSGRFYTGKGTPDLRERLSDHALAITQHGYNLSDWTIALHPMPYTNADTIRAVEKAINAYHIATQPGVVLNQRAEFEWGEFGPI